VKLVFLGRYRELAGAGSEELALPDGVRDLASLRRWLGRNRPLFVPALENPSAIVINQAIVRNPYHPVADHDEIAFLPPMSGG
jgi:molybdopterin converting factor small subunit